MVAVVGVVALLLRSGAGRTRRETTTTLVVQGWRSLLRGTPMVVVVVAGVAVAVAGVGWA